MHSINTNKTQVGFKVVTRVNSKSFKPATEYALQSFWYRLNKVTERDDPEVVGPMAVFECLEAAKEFLNSYGSTVLEVEYVASEEYGLWKKNNASSNRLQTRFEGFPIGTVFADSVLPTRIVFEK